MYVCMYVCITCFTQLNHIYYLRETKIDIEEKESSLMDQISKFQFEVDDLSWSYYIMNILSAPSKLLWTKKGSN